MDDQTEKDMGSALRQFEMRFRAELLAPVAGKRG